MAEKLKKGEMKIGEVQRKKIAGKLEEVMRRSRTGTAEDKYVECCNCSDAGNDFSYSHASCCRFSSLSASSLRDFEFKCSDCIIRCGFKGNFEIGDSGLKAVSVEIFSKKIMF